MVLYKGQWQNRIKKGGRSVMFSKMKRVFALILCLAMAVTFGACNNGTAPKSQAYEDDMSKEVTLKWYIRAAEPKGSKEVIDAFNKYIKEKINATVDIVFVQPGDYDQKIQMAMAANEKFDLVWTASWANPYQNNALKGGYLELDELLNQVPTLRDFYPDSVWDATRIGGKIYGVPNNQVLYDQQGLRFTKSICDKYNINVDEIKGLDDLTEVFQTVKDNEPNVIPARKGYGTNFLQPITEIIAPFFIDKSGKVTDRRDDIRPTYDIMRDWYQREFFPADVATMTDETSLLKAGKIFSGYSRQLPGGAEKFRIQYDYDSIMFPTADALLSRTGVQSTLTAVSATSENPIRALKLIELMQTDKYACNLMFYGLEGRDYELDPNEENRIIRNSDSYYVSEFLVGNQFLGYILPAYPADVWEQTDKANKEAPIDPNIGFSFDPTPVESEISQISAVGKEYDPILSNGLEDPAISAPAYYDKMEKAGREKVMNEIQKQYDEWKKTQ